MEMGGEMLLYFQDGLGAVLHGGDTQYGAHRLGHAALPSDDFALVLRSHLQTEDRPVAFGGLSHLDGVRIADQGPPCTR